MPRSYRGGGALAKGPRRQGAGSTSLGLLPLQIGGAAMKRARRRKVCGLGRCGKEGLARDRGPDDAVEGVVRARPLSGRMTRTGS
ncbi:MAG: hypothetical protein ACTHJ3_19185, partial [Pararhizobium sp.]